MNSVKKSRCLPLFAAVVKAENESDLRNATVYVATFMQHFVSSFYTLYGKVKLRDRAHSRHKRGEYSFCQECQCRLRNLPMPPYWPIYNKADCLMCQNKVPAQFDEHVIICQYFWHQICTLNCVVHVPFLGSAVSLYLLLIHSLLITIVSTNLNRLTKYIWLATLLTFSNRNKFRSCYDSG